jgi:hypothetical protein
MEGMKARALNRPYDDAKLNADIRRGVADVVRQQIDAVLLPLPISVDAVGSRHLGSAKRARQLRCRFQVTGRIVYKRQAAIQREIDDFKAALHGLPVADAFMPADRSTSPLSIPAAV